MGRLRSGIAMQSPRFSLSRWGVSVSRENVAPQLHTFEKPAVFGFAFSYLQNPLCA